jgi:hypothetical protein
MYEVVIANNPKTDPSNNTPFPRNGINPSIVSIEVPLVDSKLTEFIKTKNTKNTNAKDQITVFLYTGFETFLCFKNINIMGIATKPSIAKKITPYEAYQKGEKAKFA